MHTREILVQHVSKLQTVGYKRQGYNAFMELFIHKMTVKLDVLGALMEDSIPSYIDCNHNGGEPEQ